MKLKKEFEKILFKNKYYLKYNRNKKINYKNYYLNPVDPDGIKRNLLKEENYKISQIKILLEFLNKELKKQRVILDFGCGLGVLLKNLKKDYWKKYGIEINQNAYDIAKKRGINVFKNLNQIKNKKFDVITMIHVI